MRSFIAVEMVPEGIEELYVELRGTGADVKFVAPESLHLTLKFLGEVDEGRIGEIHSAMQEGLEGIAPFRVALQGMGAFPSFSYVRVVWIGVEEGKEPLMEMQRRLDDELAPLGFKREKRFEPHLTIGRLKSAKNKEKLVEVLKRKADQPFGEFQTESVTLKKSTLTPKGPIYEKLREVML